MLKVRPRPKSKVAGFFRQYTTSSYAEAAQHTVSTCRSGKSSTELQDIQNRNTNSYGFAFILSLDCGFRILIRKADPDSWPSKKQRDRKRRKIWYDSRQYWKVVMCRILNFSDIRQF